MEESMSRSEWTGRQGRFGAWFLVSPVRRWGEVLFGRSKAALLEEAFARLKGDEKVLDAGCGSGYLSLPVAARLDTGTVLCLDLSDEMLAGLDRRAAKAGLGGRVRKVKAPADSSGLDDASVDMVVCNNVLHELADPDACVAEWARVLKPGGRMLISDFRATRPIALTMSHRHGEEARGPFSLESMEELLGKAGLKEVRAVPYRHTLLASGIKG